MCADADWLSSSVSQRGATGQLNNQLAYTSTVVSLSYGHDMMIDVKSSSSRVGDSLLTDGQDPVQFLPGNLPSEMTFAQDSLMRFHSLTHWLARAGAF